MLPVLASNVAWRRAARRRRFARAVVESLLTEAPRSSIIGQVMSKATVPAQPSPAKAAPVPAASKKATPSPSRPAKVGAIDSAVLVGPDLPETGLYAKGGKAEILRQMAQDLTDLGDDPSLALAAESTVNRALMAGAMLAFLSRGKVVAVYSRELAPGRVYDKRGALLRQPDKLLSALEGLGKIVPNDLIDVGASLGGETSVASGFRLQGFRQ